jgi:hypothetical protein
MNGAGEKLQEATAYADCAVPADYDPADGAPLGSPAGTVVTAPYIAEFPTIDVNVTNVVYLDGGAYVGVCPATDQGAQLLTVEARTESGDVHELGTFVLRDDSKCTGC